MKFKPTEEQQAIVDLALKGEDVVINAYAGAAKTTTCAMIAKAVVKPSLRRLKHQGSEFSFTELMSVLKLPQQVEN